MDIPPVIRFPNSKEPDDFMSGYWEGLGDGYDLAEKSLLRNRWKWAVIGFSAGLVFGFAAGITLTFFAS